jgi:hypothetical protein
MLAGGNKAAWSIRRPSRALRASLAVPVAVTTRV